MLWPRGEDMTYDFALAREEDEIPAQRCQSGALMADCSRLLDRVYLIAMVVWLPLCVLNLSTTFPAAAAAIVWWRVVTVPLPRISNCRAPAGLHARCCLSLGALSSPLICSA